VAYIQGMRTSTYRSYNCSGCGDALNAHEVASESKFSIEGTAGTRIRKIVRQCRECYAASEYQREQASRSFAQQMWDESTPEEQAGYMARHNGQKPQGVK